MQGVSAHRRRAVLIRPFEFTNHELSHQRLCSACLKSNKVSIIAFSVIYLLISILWVQIEGHFVQFKYRLFSNSTKRSYRWAWLA